MKSPPAGKTVRFAALLKRSGVPHVHTLWVAPEKDPELKRARNEDRVLTIARPERGRASIGEVGFNPGGSAAAQFLIFPRSLQAFAQSRVVGINLDRAEQPKLTATAGAPTPPPAKKIPDKISAPKPSKPPAAPRPKQKAAPAKARRATTPASPPESPLLQNVRAAMEELEKGNPVAAYRRLERAVQTHATK